MKKFLEIMKSLNENKNGKVVTFDFDNTIVFSHDQISEDGEQDWMVGGANPYTIGLIKKFKNKNYTVFIVTSRQQHLERPHDNVKKIIDDLKLEVDGVFYTNGDRKARKLYELGSSMHFDDDPKEHEAVVAYRKLHKDFDIVMKYPDEGLSDINEASKGFIITSDDKYICLKRSDSHEWDAPGGHMRSGETPNYAFYRECKEETGLSLMRVDYLGAINVTFRGNTMPINYFTGRVQYSSDEISKVIDLQWENEDYFIGNLAELNEKLQEPHTKNFKNTLSFIENGNLVKEMEIYQKKMVKGHEKKKKKMIGLGNVKTTGAKGLKKVTDYKRSKSAPPLGEEKDLKSSKNNIKIKITDKIDEKKRKKKNRPSHKRSKKYFGSSFYDYGVLHGQSIGSSGDPGGGDGGGGE